jgi:cytochrome c oxidase subunit 4
MLRSSPLLRQLGARSTPRYHAAALTPLSSRCQSTQQTQQQQTRKAHAISNPTLANIEKRWEGMPPQEQADLWMALRDRMKVDWNEMTLQEKKAGKFTQPCSSMAAVWGWRSIRQECRRNAGRTRDSQDRHGCCRTSQQQPITATPFC